MQKGSTELRTGKHHAMWEYRPRTFAGSPRRTNTMLRTKGFQETPFTACISGYHPGNKRRRRSFEARAANFAAYLIPHRQIKRLVSVKSISNLIQCPTRQSRMSYKACLKSPARCAPVRRKRLALASRKLIRLRGRSRFLAYIVVTLVITKSRRHRCPPSRTIDYRCHPLSTRVW
jgi:hypothetical protein